MLAVTRWDVAHCGALGHEELVRCADRALHGPRCEPGFDEELHTSGWHMDVLSSFALNTWMREGGNKPLLIFWTDQVAFVHSVELEKEALAAIKSRDLSPQDYYPTVLVSVQHQHEHLFTEMGLLPTRHSHLLASVTVNELQVTLLAPELERRVLQPPHVVPLPTPDVTPCLVTVAARASLLGKTLHAYASLAAKQLNLTSQLRELPYSRRWSPTVRSPSLWLYPHKGCDVPLEYAGPIHSGRILTFLKSNVLLPEALPAEQAAMLSE